MSYSFPPDITRLVESHMASGAYSSEDDVLRDAMEALDRIELDKTLAWEARNRLASEQSEQGLSRPLDDVRVLERLHHGFLVRSSLETRHGS